MNKRAFSLLVVLAFFILAPSSRIYGQVSARKPFPYRAKYAPNSILPDVDTLLMAKEVKDFYLNWRDKYIKDKSSDEKFVDAEDRGIISEGQGYGMVIVALMAGSDLDAKSTYDKLYRYYMNHRVTSRGSYLMRWNSHNNSSATDGDLDIAYSLLLAHKQWGDDGSIKYKESARLILNDILKYEVNTKKWILLSSNQVDTDSYRPGYKQIKEYYSTRSSDFMPSHLKAFFVATQDSAWLRVIKGSYKVFDQIQNSKTGLIPDFIINIESNPMAAPANFQGKDEKHCDSYDYNACRVPWRLGAAWLLDTSVQAKRELIIINDWIKGKNVTGGDPKKIKDGYLLDGTIQNVKPDNMHLSYVAPFGVAAMTDSNNREWLTNIWNYLNSVTIDDYTNSKTKGYYDNTIKLYDMIIMSGYFWEYNESDND